MIPDPKELVQEALHKEANVRGFLRKLTSSFKRAPRSGAPAMPVTPLRPRPSGPFRSGTPGRKGREALPGTMARVEERGARKRAVIEGVEYNKRRAAMSPGFRSGFQGTSSASPAKPGTAARLQQKRDRRSAALENMRTRTFAAGPNPGQTAGPSSFSPAAARRVDQANIADSLNRRGVR